MTLRDTLLPDGLFSVKKSYRAEAGQAALLAGRLTPQLRAQLDSIAVGPKGQKKGLGQFIDEWIALGKQLGDLEDEKNRLQAAPADGSGTALVTARNQWVRVVNAMIASAELAELDIETDALIFGPLRATEKLADRRGRGGVAPADAGNNEAAPIEPAPPK